MNARRWTCVAVLWIASGCFRGEGTLGAACVDDLDCGGDQRCTNEVCGHCGDGVAQRGELCTVESRAVDGPVATAADLIALDVDRDGGRDLLTRGREGRVEIWEGGDGSWSVRATLALGGSRGALGTTMLDDDGTIDLVIADEEGSALHLGYGDDSGGWSFVTTTLDEPPMHVGAAGRGAAAPWVVWVDGRGVWQATVHAGTRGLGETRSVVSGMGLLVGDPVTFDGDDAIDLAVVDRARAHLTIWLGEAGGGLAQGQSVELEARPTAVVTSDVDGDGDADVLVTDEAGGVAVLVSDGEGTLTLAARPMVPGPARGVTVADLDRDSALDLVVVAEHEQPLWLLRARGGRYPDPIALPVDGAVGAVLAVDGDRDGLTELLLGPREGTAALRVVEVEP